VPFSPVIDKDADLKKVRSYLTDAAKYALELRARPADKRGDTYAEDFRSAVDFIGEFDPIERALKIAHDQALFDAEETERQAAKAKGGRSLGADLGDHELRSLGHQVVDSEGYAEWIAEGRQGPYSVEVRDPREVRNLISSSTSGQYSTGSSDMIPLGSPVISMPSLQRRRAFIRDVLSTGSTNLASFPYFRELTATTTETGAAMTSEGSAKTEVNLLFEHADAPARKIAGWVPVTDEMVQDAPLLMSYINNRLDYMLMIREEAQEISGNGTAPNLTGLTSVSGVQTQAAVTGDFPATIGQSISLVENVDGEADFVAANPLNFWVAVTKRYSTQFDNGFGGGAPGQIGSVTWGLPCIRTRALASGKALVGAGKLGATVFDKIGSYSIKVSDQHNDNFVKNVLVVRAEKRVALAIWRPSLFVDVTVPTT
jgi:HK97 family phage major capsid protein